MCLRITDLKIARTVSHWISGSLHELKKALGVRRGKNRTGSDDLEDVINSAGYSYDQKQDIFYSNMNAWQRNVGYSSMYDEAAAPLGIIIDCEPICFKYAGKRWMIEFWKGQYDLNTGCEIGVYSTKGPDIDIPGVLRVHSIIVQAMQTGFRCPFPWRRRVRYYLQETICTGG